MPTDPSSPTLLEILERDTSYMAALKAIEAGGPAWLS
jgi:hypothetical protein